VTNVADPVLVIGIEIVLYSSPIHSRDTTPVHLPTLEGGLYVVHMSICARNARTVKDTGLGGGLAGRREVAACLIGNTEHSLLSGTGADWQQRD